MSHCAEIRFGRTVVAIEPSKGKFGGTVVHLDNGETDWADIVIGADGLHSTVRKLIYTAEDQSLDLKSHNMLQIDGFTRVSEFSPNLGVNPCEFWGKRKMFSYYPNMMANSKNSLENKQQQHIVSFSATVFDAPKEVSDLGANLVEMQPALRELMCREFCAEEFGAGNSEDIAKIFRDAAILRPYELLKVPIMPHWHHKRACLMGDAAHGGFPSYLMQDASLCVEDAAVLATIIATLPLYNDRGWQYGFRKFEKARRYRIERHARQSQAVRDFCANTNPAVRNLMLQCTPPPVANHFLKWLSGWSYKGSEAEFDPESDEKERMSF
jgi:2-polyprenyl-6-methoxyphenol hydroxylase-like FAD-dependent oxidoreductase